FIENKNCFRLSEMNYTLQR
ncbi:hypothetical protein Ahia01_000581200, partial [Argonauta hians]